MRNERREKGAACMAAPFLLGMMRMRKTLLFLLVVFVFFAASCERRGAYWGDRLYDELVGYGHVEQINFNIAGNIVCPRCDEGEINVVGVHVEVVPQDSPMDVLALRMFDGVGPFTISNLRYKPGVTLSLECHIYTSVDPDGIGYTKKAEVNVPDDDGDTATVTINF
jgi:hypothetical protein